MCKALRFCFAKLENRLRYYAKTEKFLAKQLGGRFEP